MDGGWQQIYEKPEKELIGFYSQEHRCHIEVYARSLNVITCLKHPHRGYQILFRNSVGFTDLKKIFNNPRAHTGRGFYRINDTFVKN